ncbi:MAG: hypothetical protein U0793_32215 [Gemmataceae bacterium]
MSFASRSFIPVLGAALLAPGELSAQSKKDYEYKVTFEPARPTLGKNYKMLIQVWNNDARFSLRFGAIVLKLPEGDRLVSARSAEQLVRPGGSYTFRFEVVCGAERGSITYDLSALWE